MWLILQSGIIFGPTSIGAGRRTATWRQGSASLPRMLLLLRLVGRLTVFAATPEACNVALQRYATVLCMLLAPHVVSRAACRLRRAVPSRPRRQTSRRPKWGHPGCVDTDLPGSRGPDAQHGYEATRHAAMQHLLGAGTERRDCALGLPPPFVSCGVA
jgi:hypothetical protein